MRLILVRHARAAERDLRRYPDDGQRPLLPPGREEHQAVAKLLAGTGLKIDHLLSSPLLRARETAEITAAAFGIEPANISFRPELGAECTRASLLKLLQSFPGDAVVVVVGHEPCLSLFASHMLHPSGAVRIDFKKSGILCLDFDGPVRAGAAELKFFLTPRALGSRRK